MPCRGGRYHFLDEGRGRPVVMVHGNPTWSFYYRRLIAKLAPRFRTIVPDHLGCGLSDSPDPAEYDYRLSSRIADLEALLDQLGLSDKLTLVLHDWGGAIGIGYALRHLKQIERIVLMNTAAFLPPGGRRLPLRLRLIRNCRPLAVPAVLGLNIFARSALHMAPCRKLSADVKKGLIAPYNCWRNRIATLKFVQDIPLAASDPSYAVVKEMDENLYRLAHIPLLILWGERDFVFNRFYRAEWQRRFPHATVHAFATAGHYLLEDEPEQAGVLIEAFLG